MNFTVKARDMRYDHAAGGMLGFEVAAARATSAAQVLVPATIPLGVSVNAIYRLESAPR